MNNNINLSSISGRLTQLDGLRGLAILGVLVNHFAQFQGALQCGWAGVSLFFVLSGFLITRILLHQKKLIVENKNTFWQSISIFYTRRALRIFPLYYLIVLLMIFFNAQNAQNLSPYLLSYTFNFIVSASNFTGPNWLWSLSVEEQFYLAWPAIVLLSPSRKIPFIMSFVFFIAPAWRLGCFIWGTTRDPMYFSTFACLDCLAAGSFLAWCEIQGCRIWEKCLYFTKTFGFTLMTGWVLLTFGFTPVIWNGVSLEWLIGNTAMALFFSYLVGIATKPIESDFGALLRMRWLGYLGTISYGIYVVHMLSPPLVTYIISKNSWITINPNFILTAISIAGGAITWHFLENPIQKYKIYFPYNKNSANKNYQEQNNAA